MSTSKIVKTKFVGGIIEEKFQEKIFYHLLPDEKIPLVITTSLSIENKNGKRRNLSRLLPNDVYPINLMQNSWIWKGGEKLTSKTVYFCINTFNLDDPHKKTVHLLIYNRLNNVKGDRMSLLHEVSHRVNDHDKQLQDAEDALMEAAYRAHLTQKKSLKKNEVVIPVENDENRIVPTPVPQALHNAYLEAYAQSERDAWAYAIRKIRYFRRIGLDLEPNLQTKDDFDEVVYGEGLETYEVNASNQVLQGPKPPHFFIKNKSLRYLKAT